MVSATRIKVPAMFLALILAAAPVHADDVLDDSYEDTQRIEPPEDATTTPESGADDEPDTGAPETEPESQSPEATESDAAPSATDDLDDTYQDSHTLENGSGTGTGTGTDGSENLVDPADQVEQQMEDETVTPQGPTPDTAARESRQAWMHRHDYVGLYGVEPAGDDARFEGIYLYGYDGPTGDAGRSSGLVTILSADLPVAADEDGLGEGYLGFGVQGAAGRLSLYGTIGGVHARTVRASEETESATAVGMEAGVNVALAGRTMVTAALRDDPNELIDERRARLGLHIGSTYIGLRYGLDSERGRVDLGVRF